jgi:hypothetical protein
MSTFLFFTVVIAYTWAVITMAVLIARRKP